MASPTHQLADQLRKATSGLHKIAETTGVVNEMLNQQLRLKDYVLYMRNLYEVYEAMEGVASTLEGSLRQFFGPELCRAESIRRDLHNMAGTSWRDLSVLDSTTTYSKRLLQLTKDNSLPLLGHAYVRYLGDLNGGQILPRLISRQLELPTNALSFYIFEDIEDIINYKKQYRELLNCYSVTRIERDSIVQEAIRAFELNIALSTAVKEERVSRA